MDNKWVEKIEALMRKAEDPATPEAERESIIDKVTYLMTKHGIEQDMLNVAQNKPFEAMHQKIHLGSLYFNSMSSIMNTISIAFGCFMVNIDNIEQHKVSVFGTEEDIERVFMLYHSLKLQMLGSLAASQTHKPKGMHGKTWNSSFVHGFTVIINRRIREAANRAKEDLKRESTGNGMELVLLNKQEVIVRKVREFFPRLTTIASNLRTTSAAAYGHGQAAGQRADLGGSRISSTHAGRRALGS